MSLRKKDKGWQKTRDYSFKSKVTKILRVFSRGLSERLVSISLDHLNKNWNWVFIVRWLVYIEDDLFSN